MAAAVAPHTEHGGSSSRCWRKAPQSAHTAQQGNDLPKAQRLLAQVLEIDPTNADALALKAGVDPPDAGSGKK